MNILLVNRRRISRTQIKSLKCKHPIGSSRVKRHTRYVKTSCKPANPFSVCHADRLSSHRKTKKRKRKKLFDNFAIYHCASESVRGVGGRPQINRYDVAELEQKR